LSEATSVAGGEAGKVADGIDRESGVLASGAMSRPTLSQRPASVARLVEKLERRGRALDVSEIAALAQAISQTIEYAPGRDMVREHDYYTESNLLIAGWCYRYSDLPDGRRQTLALHMAGDFVDLHSFQLKRMDHSVRTLTACTVAIVPHDNLTRITEEFPHLTRQLWFSTLIDAAIMRRWMVGLGQRSALEHMAHLFCEIYYRARLVNLVADGVFAFPLTQAEIGEAVGISAVHSNRVLQQLRARKLIALSGRTVKVLDLEALERVAGFDPTYLNLDPADAPPDA
jgi:CRP-like cAMP-binding protein